MNQTLHVIKPKDEPQPSKAFEKSGTKDVSPSKGALIPLKRYMMYYLDGTRMVAHMHSTEEDAWKDAKSYIDSGASGVYNVVEVKGKLIGRNEFVSHEVRY